MWWWSSPMPACLTTVITGSCSSLKLGIISGWLAGYIKLNLLLLNSILLHCRDPPTAAMADHGGGEDELWKCKKHPSRRRGSGGVCCICLRDRLLTLCPNCAKDLPCSCASAYANGRPSSSSSSSSYSFSSYSSSSSAVSSHVSCTAIGAVGRMANLIDQEPPFRRTTASFPWSFLKRETDINGSPSRRSFCVAAAGERRSPLAEEENGEVRRLIRSRSVGRERVWYLFSPMKVFRRIKSKKIAAGGGDRRRQPVL